MSDFPGETAEGLSQDLLDFDPARHRSAVRAVFKYRTVAHADQPRSCRSCSNEAVKEDRWHRFMQNPSPKSAPPRAAAQIGTTQGRDYRMFRGEGDGEMTGAHQGGTPGSRCRSSSCPMAGHLKAGDNHPRPASPMRRV